MNIEHLSQSQLLLLVLLVSFVTSIATGVLTVSLLDEAPQTVTQTVNRVVERTIERVAAPEENQNQGAAAVTTERTVVVKEEDLVPQTVAAHAPRVVSIHVGATSTPAIASGLFMPGRAVIATAKAGITNTENLIAVFSTGQAYSLREPFTTDSTEVAVLNPILGEGEALPSVASFELAALESAQRGQTILTLTTRGAVKSGIVEFQNGDLLETSLPEKEVPYGATLITTFGDILGMHTGAPSESGATFVGSQSIFDTLALYDAVQAAATE